MRAGVKTDPVLAIVVPCYKEEETLPVTAPVLGKLMQEMIDENLVSSESFICFVNDGSRDGTWPEIVRLQGESPMYRGINLSRNFGHQSALMAGLLTADADIYASIDADLQDDEQKIPEMVRMYHEGKDIVYGCRAKRDSDAWFKRTTAEMFYSVRAWIGCDTIRNHADYRLMSRRAVDELRKFREVNLYLRGVVPLLGFPSGFVYYDRKVRQLGESKYPLMKMLRFAWNGVVNFSEFPLLCVVWAGVISFVLSLVMIGWSLIQWAHGATVPGWTSTVLTIAVFGSLQFIFTGVVGLYIAKIFKETKRRPLYIVQEDNTPHRH